MGKLTSQELKDNVLSIIEKRRKEVQVGAGISEDCASFESNGLCLISSDPITGAQANIGSLAIKINCNDIIAGGGEPMLATMTLIMPTDATTLQIKDIMKDAESEAIVQNIEIVGGHTEFSSAVNQPIVSCTVVGKAFRHIRSSKPNIGDDIIVTKHIGIEGTSILAREHQEYLSQFLSEQDLAYAIGLEKLISIRGEGEVARKFDISSMHDITEGGIFGAVAEMCDASGIGATIVQEKIPVLPVTIKVCEKLSVDYFRLISSGSLLITSAKSKELIEELAKNDILATVIGKIDSTNIAKVQYLGTQTPIFVSPDQLFIVEKHI